MGYTLPFLFFELARPRMPGEGESGRSALETGILGGASPGTVSLGKLIAGDYVGAAGRARWVGNSPYTINLPSLSTSDLAQRSTRFA